MTNHWLMSAPPQCHNILLSGLSLLSSTIHGNSPKSELNDGARVNSALLDKPHSPLNGSGKKLGLEELFMLGLFVVVDCSILQHTFFSFLLQICFLNWVNNVLEIWNHIVCIKLEIQPLFTLSISNLSHFSIVQALHVQQEKIHRNLYQHMFFPHHKLGLGFVFYKTNTIKEFE